MTTSKTFPLYLADAFAEGPYRGNPAAVCLLEGWPDDVWLQQIAAEMNQSETAFLVPDEQGYHLRWFTPKVEVDLCGHATLASAFVLGHAKKVAADQRIHFSTRSGTLRATPRGGRIELDFPLTPQQPADPAPGLLAALGVQAIYVGRNADYLVEVASAAEVRALAPDFRALAAVECRGVIVTAQDDSGQFDFISRFFAPSAGIDEDPVTGSAHCTLAHHWRERLQKSVFLAQQASRRGGLVSVTIDGDRVRLGGQARLVVSGELYC